MGRPGRVSVAHAVLADRPRVRVDADAPKRRRRRTGGPVLRAASAHAPRVQGGVRGAWGMGADRGDRDRPPRPEGPGAVLGGQPSSEGTRRSDPSRALVIRTARNDLFRPRGGGAGLGSAATFHNVGYRRFEGSAASAGEGLSRVLART